MALDSICQPGGAAEGTHPLDAVAQGVQLFRCLRLVDVPGPVVRTPDRPVVKQRWGVARPMVSMPQAAPAPVFRPLDKVCPQRIAFDVTAHGQQVSIGFNREGYKPPLVEVALTGSAAERMPALRMSQCQPPGKSRQVIVFAWPERHVPVVRHDAKCQQAHSEPISGLDQQLLEGQVVGR